MWRFLLLLSLLLAGCDRIGRVVMPPLSLREPIGSFTGRQLALLGEDAPRCRVLLDAAGVSYTPLPPLRQDQCGYADGVTLRPGGTLAVRFRPAGLGVACPVAAALVIWEREVVRPAAQRHFGRAVTGIDHYGSYNCRRLYGRSAGDWSEHARANAVDIAGFRLADGRSITVRGDWQGDPARAAFLREVRDGACRLFATVLSPDYNAAHADHLHLDQATRGGYGGRACG